MINNISHFKNRRNSNEENGSAMIFAILLLMILLLTTVIVTTYATTSVKTSGELSSREVYRDAANAGLQNALLTANNNSNGDALSVQVGATNAVTGTYNLSATTRADVKWTWYTEAIPLPGQRIGYYVYATGYSPEEGIENGVKLRAQIDPILVSGATWDAEKKNVSYSISFDSPFQLGLTGSNEVTIEGTAKVYSSDSSVGINPGGTTSERTSAATNGTMNITAPNPGLKVKSFTLPSEGFEPCTGAGCATSETIFRDYAIDLKDFKSSVDSQCTVADGIWRASEHNGILDIPNGSCVQQIIFDRHTTVPASYTKNAPLKIYTKSSTIVYKGARVNVTNSPAALRIFSSSGDVTIGDPTDTFQATTDTYFAGYVTTYDGICKTYDKSKFFGAMACNRINILSGSVVYQDLANINTNTTARNIWTTRFTEEL